VFIIEPLCPIAGAPLRDVHFNDWIQLCFKYPHLYIRAGARIDHGHHETRAKKALHDTLAMEEAVQAALNMTDEADTLIIVTADHSHVMTINGYPERGNDILGIELNAG